MIGLGTPAGGAARSSSAAATLLLECHDRIRAFLATARRIAEAEGAPPAQVAEAAAAVQRYFTVALPLHAEDEERSILPRLRGRDDATDAALERMVEEHRAHEATVRALVAICAELTAAPRRRAMLTPALRSTLAWLDRHFAEHLGGEEAVVVPAMERLLSAAEDQAIFAEMRARRQVS